MTAQKFPEKNRITGEEDSCMAHVAIVIAVIAIALNIANIVNRG